MTRKTAAKPARKPAPPSPRKSAEQRRRAAAIYGQLLKLYPDAHCELDHKDAFQLLVATILSAQCTDKRVNLVTPALFAKYPDAAALAAADPDELEALIRSTGFFRSKSKSLRGAARRIRDGHAGNVPDTMNALLELPGVARKTANVVLGNAFGKNEGVVVDTHVARLSFRLGLTGHADPIKIERDLIALFDRDRWRLLSHLLICHGRRTCAARKPDCANCPLARDCPKRGVKT